MTDATLLIEDVLRPAVRLERHLPDPPLVVWRALTEREQLRPWFPCDVAVSGGSSSTATRLRAVRRARWSRS